jgi:Concanavalin A-like lectin/glucanases superfamily
MAVYIPNTNGSYLGNYTWSGSATQNLTVMCWTNLSGPTTGSYRNIMSVEPNVHLQTYSDGYTFDAGTETTDHLGPLLAANTWYHITESVICTSTTSRQIFGYVNGQEVVNVADTSTFTAYTGFTVGNYAGNFNGGTYHLPASAAIRDFRIWTRCLGPTEVVQEMHSKIPVNKKALLLEYRLDDNTTYDNSGNGYTLTPVGTGIILQAGPLQPYIKSNAIRWIT